MRIEGTAAIPKPTIVFGAHHGVAAVEHAVPVAPGGNGVGGSPPRPEEHRVAADRHPVMLDLSASERAAVAGVTGVYVSASGEVTPEGAAPWSFILQYIAQRRAERPGPAAGQRVPAAGAEPPTDPAAHVDLSL